MVYCKPRIIIVSEPLPFLAFFFLESLWILNPIVTLLLKIYCKGRIVIQTWAREIRY